MAITARELVFYIRAEDQASRVVKRAAKSFGSLANIKSLQKGADELQIKNARRIAAAQQAIRKGEDAVIRARAAAAKTSSTTPAELAAQQRIDQVLQSQRRNQEALLRAQAQSSKLSRLAGAGKAQKGFTVSETRKLVDAAASSVVTLQRQNKLLEQQGIAAKIAATRVAAEQKILHDAALSNVATLNRQQELLIQDEEEVRRMAAAASAALDAQIKEAQIARLEQYATGIKNLARSLRLVGIVGIAAFGYAANSAAKFSQQVTLAASQARPPGAGAAATAKIAAQLQDEILKQMNQFPATSQEMADAFYQVFSSTNIQGVKQAAGFVKELNKAAVAGGVDLGSMSNAAITLFNNFVGKDKEFKNITQALDVFFAAVRYGRMDATQFANSLSNVVGIAAEAGLTFKDVADAIATLTRQTGAKVTGRDATGIARLIETLSKPEITTGLENIGVQVVDPLTKKMRPLLQIITDIKAKADLRGVNALNFFKTISAAGSGGAGTSSTIQARRAFAFLIQNLNDYHKVSGDIANDNKEFEKSFQALSKTPGVQWQVVQNQMRAAAIVIGREAIPALVALAQPLVHLLHWFNSLDDSTKHLIATVGVFGSAFLVIGGTIAIVATTFFNFWQTLRLFKLGKIASEAGFLNTRLAIMAGIFGVLLLLLIPFHNQITKLITGAQGLEGILKLVAIAATALATRALVVLVGQMAVAVIGTEGLSAAMVTLRSATLLEITAIGLLGYALSRALDAAGLDKFKEVGSKVYDITHRGQSNQNTPTLPNAQNDIKKIQQLYEGMRARIGSSDVPVPKSTIEKQLEALFPQLSAGAIRVFVDRAARIYSDKVKGMTKTQFTESSRTANFGRIAVKAGTLTTSTMLSDKEFLKQIRHVHDLQKAFETAPNITVALNAWRKYHTALDSLTKASTEEQKKMIDDLIASVDNASSGGVSEKIFVTQLNRIHQLQQAAEKAPNLSAQYKAYQALNAAESALNKKLSNSQQQTMSDILSNWKGALSGGLSDSIFESQLRHIHDLQKAAEKAPDLSAQVAAYAALDNAQTSLDKNLSDSQKQVMTDILGNWKDLTTSLSDQQVIALTRQADKIQKKGEKTADPKIWKKYYAIQKQLQDNALQDQITYADSIVSSEQAIHDKKVQLAKDAADRIKQNAQNARDVIDSATQGIESMYNTLLDQNKTLMGELFQGPVIQGPRVQDNIQFGGFATGKDMLHDLQTQLLQYKLTNKQFDALAKRGAPKGLIDQLKAIGPDSAKDVKQLLTLNPTEFNQLVGTYNRAQALIKKNTSKQLDAQLTIYQSHGKKIALAIIRGIRSEDIALEDTLRNFVLKMFPGLTKQARIKHVSESKTAAKAVTNIKTGTIRDIHRNTENITNVQNSKNIENVRNTHNKTDSVERKTLNIVNKTYEHGEMVSHFLARGIDPKLSRLYKLFTKTITPDQKLWMRRDYARSGETGPFVQYEQMAGLPALFRGKLFDQLDRGDVTYTKRQLAIFNDIKKILMTGQGVLIRAAPPARPLNSPKTTKPAGPTTVHYHEHYDIKTTAQPGDIRTQLKHADLIKRNKYRPRVQ